MGPCQSESREEDEDEDAEEKRKKIAESYQLWLDTKRRELKNAKISSAPQSNKVQKLAKQLTADVRY